MIDIYISSYFEHDLTGNKVLGHKNRMFNL